MAPANEYAQVDWYDSPFYYDLIFNQGTEGEADFIEAAWRKHGRLQRNRRRSSLRILEPACGSGRLIHALACRGHRVAGFDRNAAMLAAARTRCARAGHRATLKRASLESFSMSGTFDISHCLLSTFKYILEEDSTIAHLLQVSDHLSPGGLYILGLHLTDYSRESCEHERWTAHQNGVHVTCNTRTWSADKKTRLEKLRNRMRIRHDGEPGERCLETRWECRTYSQGEFFRLLANVPALKPVAFYDFNHDINHPKPMHRAALRDDVVFILRKEEA